MKQLILVLLFSAFSFISNAQTKITTTDIAKHINDSVELISQVFGVKYFSDTKGSTTLVNFGAAYPNQLFTAVIHKDVRDQMLLEPTEENLKNKKVTVTGKVEMYKGKPQIVIKDPSQFQVIDKDGEVLPFRN